MSATAGATFPLVPRRAFVGLQGGTRRSLRRGEGDEVVGARPYRPGDPVSSIDWAASAKLSTARGADEFVVQEHYAAEAPRVAIVVDDRPAMTLYEPPLPWLDKRAAVQAAVELIDASARRARVDVHREPSRGHDLGAALRSLGGRRARLPVGSFVFVLSDFVDEPEARHWVALRARRLDVTPVVVQDPTWEQSFPVVGGVTVPFVAADGGVVEEAWLSRREAEELRAANVRRLATSLERFRRLGFDPVVLGSSDPNAVLRAFHAWAGRRRTLRRRAA